MSSNIKNSSNKSSLNNKILKNINLLSLVLNNILKNNKILTKKVNREKNKSKINNNEENSFFFLEVVPDVSIYEYIERIVYYTKIETSTLILALSYIDRIIADGYILNESNLHLTILASIIISMKVNEDIILNSKFYSYVGLVSKEVIFEIENEMLNYLDYKLIMNKSEYKKYKIHFK